MASRRCSSRIVWICIRVAMALCRSEYLEPGVKQELQWSITGLGVWRDLGFKQGLP